MKTATKRQSLAQLKRRIADLEEEIRQKDQAIWLLKVGQNHLISSLVDLAWQADGCRPEK